MCSALHLTAKDKGTILPPADLLCRSERGDCAAASGCTAINSSVTAATLPLSDRKNSKWGGNSASGLTRSSDAADGDVESDMFKAERDEDVDSDSESEEDDDKSPFGCKIATNRACVTRINAR